MKDLSIVLVSMNNVSDVRKTVKSILTILGSDIQLIVIDSSSNKSIEQTIKSINCDAEIIYEWQEPQGIYPAMNAAISLSGDENLIWFLNPGDTLTDSRILSELRRKINKDRKEWGFAQAVAENPKGAIPFPDSSDLISSFELLSGRLRISHQAMLISKNSLQNIGNFDVTFKIASDFQMQYRLLASSEPSFVESVLVQFDTAGISHDRLFLTFLESTRIRIRSGEIPLRTIFVISLRIVCRRVVGFVRNRMGV